MTARLCRYCGLGVEVGPVAARANYQGPMVHAACRARALGIQRGQHLDRLRDYLRQAGGPVAAEATAALDDGRLDVVQGILAEPAAYEPGLCGECMHLARRSLREAWTADLPSRARVRVAEWRAARALPHTP